MALPISLTKDEFRLLTGSSCRLTLMTIELQTLQRHCPLDNDRLHPRTPLEPKNASLSNVGQLETLPLEIIYLILSKLDLQSLTDLRAISWRARALVDGFPPYSAIVQHSSDALRALLSTHMAVHFTAGNIFEALCTQACFNCGDFGPLLDMFTGLRCCLTCVMHSDNLLSVTTFTAKRKFGLNSKTMLTLPTLLSLPGKYSQAGKLYQKRMSLVRVLSATEAASIQHGSNTASQRPLPSISELGIDRQGQNPYRFMGVVRFPSLDQRTGNLDRGVSCQGCEHGPRDPRRGYCNWNTMYSAAGYLEHFQKCQVSQRGKEAVPRYIMDTRPTGEYHQCIPNFRFLGFLGDRRF